MSAPIAVGTLVMVTRTGTGLDGATGVVEGGLMTRKSLDVRTGHIGYCIGYVVRLSRLTPWGEVMAFHPHYLIPIAPPDTDTSTPRDTPVQTELVPV